ncbi:hypothetical protein CDAR_417111 [Caerostris darwini]|uniref:Uncharacterized protein n=1 Tax=Caerostris darwini TaxID=1538125 RepID=A0AAV4X4X9_9ARAC|nr:hypothetical protein CDAR_417111 [Caerostris darwini]
MCLASRRGSSLLCEWKWRGGSSFVKRGVGKGGDGGGACYGWLKCSKKEGGGGGWRHGVGWKGKELSDGHGRFVDPPLQSKRPQRLEALPQLLTATDLKLQPGDSPALSGDYHI